jgi:UDP-glucose 4-epimerase
MHTLVTGGAGFIGTALVERLLAEGHSVDVADNLSSGSLWHLADARASAGRNFAFHQVDVRAPEITELIVRRRPEVVWHLAAHPEGGTAAAEAHTDVVGALAVLEGVRAGETRKLVVASAASVYGEGGDRALSEAHARRPLSAAAVGKHAVDAYLAVYAELEQVRFSSLVIANAYGPRTSRGVVGRWAEALVSGRPCTVFGDGSQVRDFVYIDDVVDALARAADRADGMIVNVGTGEPTSMLELHAAMVEAAGRSVDDDRGPPLGLHHAAARPGEPHSAVLDPTRAAEVLGWQPWTALGDGLDAVFASYRKRSSP